MEKSILKVPKGIFTYLMKKTCMVRPIKRKGVRNTEMDLVLEHIIEEWFAKLGNRHDALWGSVSQREDSIKVSCVVS